MTRYDVGDGHVDEVDDGPASECDRVVIDIDAKSGRAFITASALASLMDQIDELRADRDHWAREAQRERDARQIAGSPSVQALLGEALAILNDMPQEGHRGEQVAAWLRKVRSA